MDFLLKYTYFTNNYTYTLISKRLLGVIHSIHHQYIITIDQEFFTKNTTYFHNNRNHMDPP
ncbi:Hypothetical protein ERWE_CDS_08980 [Ehrlichia ruminantium str. Welgevonden]|uniref:Uncharacterized protein n=1 Tax=Ehrlichia ruminantium (strain Welgevonden) TaxID=254945 RepID=A0A0H3M0D5_EHRRW|nr:Hypothetical protein ERWE_CDS_08980 [Ehrlichia ruminantium str. Welgevonden]